MEDLYEKFSSICNPSLISVPPSSCPITDKAFLSRSLVVKVLTDQEVRKPSLRESLLAAWQLKGSCTFKEYGDGLFLVTFDVRSDSLKVLTSGPWIFKGDFILVRRCVSNFTPSMYKFDSIGMWVHIHGLPIEYSCLESLKVIVAPIGELCEPSEEALSKWGAYVRVKLLIPVDRGLIGQVLFPLPGNEKHCLRIQYEKLERFCSFCGRLGHVKNSCEFFEELNATLSSDETCSHVKQQLSSLPMDSFLPSLKAPSLKYRKSSPIRSRSPTQRQDVDQAEQRDSCYSQPKNIVGNVQNMNGTQAGEMRSNTVQERLDLYAGSNEIPPQLVINNAITPSLNSRMKPSTHSSLQFSSSIYSYLAANISNDLLSIISRTMNQHISGAMQFGPLHQLGAMESVHPVIEDNGEGATVMVDKENMDVEEGGFLPGKPFMDFAEYQGTLKTDVDLKDGNAPARGFDPTMVQEMNTENVGNSTVWEFGSANQGKLESKSTPSYLVKPEGKTVSKNKKRRPILRRYLADISNIEKDHIQGKKRPFPIESNLQFQSKRQRSSMHSQQNPGSRDSFDKAVAVIQPRPDK